MKPETCLSTRSVLALPVVVVAAALAAAGSVRAQEDAAPEPDTAGEEQSIIAYLSEDALQAQYERALDLDGTAFRGRAGIFYNERRDLIAIGDLLAPVAADGFGRDVRVHLGTRVYGAFLAEEDQDLFAISVGGEAEYFFGGGTSVLLAAYYSPDILTFGSADNFTDITLRLRMRISDTAYVFVGYRTFEIDTLTDREVDDNMHVGFMRSF